MFKLTIDRSVLNNEITYLREILDKKPINEILSNYLFKLVYNEAIEAYDLFISATDLDLYITTKLSSFTTTFSEKTLSWLVPAKELTNIISKLGNTELHFSFTEINEHLELKALKSKHRLMTASAEDFINEPEKIDPMSFSLPTELLKDMTNRVVPTFSIDEEKDSRFNLSGIKFDLLQGLDKDKNPTKELNLVFALNNKLHFITSKLNYIKSTPNPDGKNLPPIQEVIDIDPLTKDSITCLIPRTSIKFLSKLCNTDIDTINIEKTENHMFFTIGNRTFVTRLLSGQFPNYKVMANYKHNSSIPLNRKEFYNCIDRALAINNDKQKSIRLFNAKSNSLFIRSETRLGNSEDIYDDESLDIAGTEIQAKFYFNHVESFLRNETNEQISFHWDKGKKSILKFGAIYDKFQSYCLFSGLNT